MLQATPRARAGGVRSAWQRQGRACGRAQRAGRSRTNVESSGPTTKAFWTAATLGLAQGIGGSGMGSLGSQSSGSGRGGLSPTVQLRVMSVCVLRSAAQRGIWSGGCVR